MRDSVALRAMERLELFLYRKASAVVAVTASFKRNLISRGIDGDKIAVVTNGVDLTRFQPQAPDLALRDALGIPREAFVAGYIGTHGMAHALETVLEAARLLGAEGDAGPVAVHFILLGDGARKEALKAQAANLGLVNVHFLDSVPKAEVPRYWSLMDVAIIHLRKADNFTQVIPSKLFECMGMGIPVLHGVAGESAGIVEREGVGLVFPPEDAQALRDGVLRLAEDLALYQRLKANCLAAGPRYERATLAREMLGVLETVAGKAGTVSVTG